MLDRLDQLEGYPSPYTRALIDAKYGDARIYLSAGRVNPVWPAINSDWYRYRQVQSHSTQGRHS